VKNSGDVHKNWVCPDTVDTNGLFDAPGVDVRLLLLLFCKGSVELLMKLRLTVVECHLPYVITQCYLSPDTSERTPPSPQPDRPVLDLPAPEGRKAELTYKVTCYIPRWFTRLQTVAHPSTNQG